MSDKLLYLCKEIITENFIAYEWAKSAKKPGLAKKITYNQNDIDIFRLHSQAIVQPVRQEFPEDIITTLSGKRSEELNNAIGGDENSLHLSSGALDWTSRNLLLKFMWIYYNCDFSELIYYPEQKFIHSAINIPGKIYQSEAFVKFLNDDTYYVYNGGNIPTPNRIV